MVSLIATNDLLSINGHNSNPRTQFIIASYRSRLRLPPLVTSIKAESTSFASKLPNLVVEFKSKCARYSLVLSKRIVNLRLKGADIYCMNTRLSRLNDKKRRVIVPKTTLNLDIGWTRVLIPPTGQFISLRMCSYKTFNQGRLTESSISVHYYSISTMTLGRMPKSIMSISVCVGDEPRSHLVYKPPVFNTRHSSPYEFATDKHTHLLYG